MPSPRLALALGLCAVLLLVSAVPADATSRDQAASKAVAALGSKKGSSSVIVFGLTAPLRPGTLVTQQGSNKTVLKVGRERAYFFYEDAAPFRLYPHAGRVVLVGTKTGKVRVSRSIRRAPLVNYKLPAFLKTTKSYRSSKYRVFHRLVEGSEADESSASTFSPSASSNAFEIEDPGPQGNSHAQPKADPQSVTVKQNSPKRITLTGSDDDGDLLTFFIVKPPDHGTLSGQPPDLTYTPDPGYLGKDDFSFKADDSEHVSNSAKVFIDVVPLGLPPIVVTSAGCTAYTENSPAVAVDGALTVFDPDDVSLDSARVRIATSFQAGDVLTFTDQNGITSSYDDNTGVLVLSGTSSVANYQAALRTVRYRNQAVGNPSAVKDIEFIVNDAGNDSAPATKQVCTTGGTGTGNDAPTGEPSEGGLSYIENDGPVPLDSGFVVGDPDSPNLSGATVKFVPYVSQPVDENGDPVGPPVSTVTFAPDEDELGFTDQNGIEGDYNDTTGVLTLTGTTSIENYEAAIRSVTYENVSEDPSDATRRMRFQVTDSSGLNSVARTRDTFVTPVNDAPVVTASEGSTDYTGSATAVDPGLTTLDVDDDDLESARVRISEGLDSADALEFSDQNGITGSYDGESGVLSLSGTASVDEYETALRSVEYVTTAELPSGERTVEFVVNDGDLDSEPSTKHVEINDAPVLDSSDDALAYTEGDGAVAVDSGITAADVDSPNLAGATVTISSNFVEAEDALAFADQNGIEGDYDDTTGVLTLTGSASVADYEAALRDVRYENSSEDPSDATRTVTFQVDDGAPINNLSGAVTRDVTVTPVNDAPVVTTSAGATSYTEGDAATTIDSAVTVADVDHTDLESAQVQITSGFQEGDELALDEESHPGISVNFDSGTGVLTLIGTAPVADYQAALADVAYQHTGDNPSSPKTVTFFANDGIDTSAGATKDIEVAPVNDPPAVTTSSGSTAYGIGDTIGVEVDDALTATDPDDTDLESAQVRISSGFEAGDNLVLDEDSLTGIAVDYFPGTGVMTLTGTASVEDYQAALRMISYRYTGEAPPTSPKTVEFTVNDGDADSNAATKQIVLSDNEAPVVTTSAGSTPYTLGDTSGVDVDSALTVTDADDTDLEGGTVRVSADFQLGDDLVFVDQAGISGEYNTGTGVLTLTGPASLAAYETALRSIKYRYAGEDPPTATKEVEFVVNDGIFDSNPAMKGIAVIQIEL